MKSGVYRGISHSDYHADLETYSCSLIKQMDIPALARYRMDNPTIPTEAMRLGTAIHGIILEDKQPLIGITAGRRSKADKRAWETWFDEYGADGAGIVQNNPAAKWNGLFELETGLIMTTPDELAEILLMAESVKSNPDAMQLLTGGGEAESSLYWRDKETGLQLRCRPDYLSAYCTDLKSITAIDNHTIDRAIANMGYALQDAMYSDGCIQATGENKPFVFLFVAKSAPYLTRIIGLSEEEKQRGWNRYRRNVKRLAECLETDTWPGLPTDLNHSLFQRDET